MKISIMNTKRCHWFQIYLRHFMSPSQRYRYSSQSAPHVLAQCVSLSTTHIHCTRTIFTCPPHVHLAHNAVLFQTRQQARPARQSAQADTSVTCELSFASVYVRCSCWREPQHSAQTNPIPVSTTLCYLRPSKDVICAARAQNANAHSPATRLL